MKPFTAFVCSTSFLVSAVSAQAQTAELATPTTEFSESYMGAAEVSSAGVLVGYSVGNTVDWKANQIPVSLPNGYDGEVCLRATSLDGRFWSLNPYRIATTARQVQLGPVSKAFMKTLRKMPDSYMALRVYGNGNGNCDDIRGSRFFPTQGQSDDDLVFLVNSSGRKSFARLRFEDGTTSRAFACSTITDVVAVAADKRCTITTTRNGTDAQVEFAFVGTSGQPEIVGFEIRIPE